MPELTDLDYQTIGEVLRTSPAVFALLPDYVRNAYHREAGDHLDQG